MLMMVVTAYIEQLWALFDDIDVHFRMDANGQQVLKVPIPELANKRLIDQNAAKEYLHSIYPALCHHYHWFCQMQQGQIQHCERTTHSHTQSYKSILTTNTHV